MVAQRLSGIGRAEMKHRLSPVQIAGARPVLITGGAGNIGLALGDELVRLGQPVVALDNLSRGPGHKRALEIAGISLHHCDLTDFGATLDVFKSVRPAAVFHAGSYIEVGESMRKPDMYIWANCVGGQNLFQVMQETGTKNLVFANTAAVFDGTIGELLTEDSPWNPGSVYGSTKAFQARLLQEGRLFPSLKTVSFHFFNVFGTRRLFFREDHGLETESHLIPIALQVAIYNLVHRFGLKVPGYQSEEVTSKYLAGKRSFLPVFGNDYELNPGVTDPRPAWDRTCIRDYIDMRRLTAFLRLGKEALEKAAINEKFSPFVLGTGTGFSVFQIVNEVEQAVRRSLGWKPLTPAQLANLDHSERIIPSKVVDRRPGDVAFLAADPVKANKLFGKMERLPRPDIGKRIEDTFWSLLYRPFGYSGRPAVSDAHPVLSFYQGGGE